MTDAGISALSAGCGQLQSINLAGCNNVTDAGILALSAGCGQLQITNQRGNHLPSADEQAYRRRTRWWL